MLLHCRGLHIHYYIYNHATTIKSHQPYQKTTTNSAATNLGFIFLFPDKQITNSPYINMSCTKNLHALSLHHAISPPFPNTKALSLNWPSRMVEQNRRLTVCSVMSSPDTWTQTRTQARSTTTTDLLQLIDKTEESLFRTGKFGRFGGIFVPETLVTCLNMLAVEFTLILHDPQFQVHIQINLLSSIRFHFEIHKTCSFVYAYNIN